MTEIQNALAKALDAMNDRSKFTDSVLAKKLREVAGIDGKKKAVIALADLMAATQALEQQGKIFSITITAANDLLIERTDSPKEISLENRQRRQRHEKSQALFTNADLNAKSSGKNKKVHAQKRTERSNMDINIDYE